MSSISRVWFGIALLFAGVASDLHATADPIDEVRALYFLATSTEAAVEQGLDAVSAARGETSTQNAALLSAYEGALLTLKAKYVFWPTTRLRHLNQGLAALDSLVADYPQDSEIRYLRLMSCYHLPSFLGRGQSVREDFAALARSLPGDQAAMPAKMYRGAADFLIENGRLSPEQIRAVRASIE